MSSRCFCWISSWIVQVPSDSVLLPKPAIWWFICMLVWLYICKSKFLNLQDIINTWFICLLVFCSCCFQLRVWDGYYWCGIFALISRWWLLLCAEIKLLISLFFLSWCLLVVNQISCHQSNFSVTFCWHCWYLVWSLSSCALYRLRPY